MLRARGLPALGLADLDQVPVRVADVGAVLAWVVFRLGEELGSAR
jgi:hypothetical protein